MTLENRVLHRETGMNILYPVSCILRGSGREYIAEVVNYHFKGACLRVDGIPESDRASIRDGSFKLDFYLGQNCLQSDIPYRMSWRDERDSFVFGVEFQKKIAGNVERSERFVTNQNMPIQVTVSDPMDPHRLMYFQTIDISESGMLLRTSLSNKHLLPGIKLINAQIQIPSQPTQSVDLWIENARAGLDDSSFLLGVTIKNAGSGFTQAVRGYLTVATPYLKDIDSHLDRLSASKLRGKLMKAAVSYRIIQTQEQYDQVLRLRFSGYGKHDKVKAGTTWRDQGEGLENEGVVIGGYLGAQLVCSMELRFGNAALPLRVEKMAGPDGLKGFNRERVVEVNKLVVHPKAQGTDLVLGILQRAHAIVINRGHLDILGVATDKLKSLYESMGAEATGTRFPHPYLENESLNVMLVRREVYHDGFRFNPHAWSVVYKTVHEHFSSMGMAQKRSFSWKEQAVASVTRLVLDVRKNRKKSESPSRQERATKELPRVQTFNSGKFVDPKWTRHEIVASIMLPYIREAQEMVGSSTVGKILEEIGIPESYFVHQSNWLSVAFHDAFLDAFSAYGDSEVLSKRAGVRSMKRDMLGLNYYVMKHFMTPELAYASFSKIMPKFNRTRSYEVSEYGPGRGVFSMGVLSNDLLPKRRESCINWQASFEAYIRLMTGRPGKIKKLSCCYDGARTCSYEVFWEQKYFKPAKLLPWVAALGAGVFGYLHPALLPSGWLSATASVAIVTILVSRVNLRWLRLDFDSSYREFLKFQQDANEKYSELQQSKLRTDELYREARLIEQTMRDIQKKEDMGSLLQTALDVACSSFNFDRAFAMVVDENRDVLRTAAVAGLREYSDALWKFSVKVNTKRDNPMLMSSVFHSGSSVLMNDIEEHFFQLNEASQKIIRQFGSKGFVMVAIPARGGNWGVIIADKRTSERKFDRRDLVVLERLSQQIGLALDKRSDLLRERNLRTQFQRYAPSGLLLASENLEQQALLGAQIKRVGILFMDIRGFTQLSETLSPAKTVELINGIFSLLDPIVRRHGGIVDKYLGDGALVTWGSLGSAAPNPETMLNCAVDFLNALEVHNVSLNAQGLLAMQVGMGLHIGDALVGTVGSKERLEYTAIGPTVNLASRLEQLCKTYSAQIVASEALMSALNVEVGEHWQTVRDVSIRGVKQAVTIWIYKHSVSSSRIVPALQEAS